MTTERLEVARQRAVEAQELISDEIQESDGLAMQACSQAILLAVAAIDQVLKERGE